MNAVHGDDSSPGMNVAWGFTSASASAALPLTFVGAEFPISS